MRVRLAITVLSVLASCGPDIAERNVASCRAATRAERSVLGACVDDLPDEDCDAYDTQGCDWSEHFHCRRDQAYEVEDCGASGAVEAWEDALETCPPAYCDDDLKALAEERGTGDDDEDDR